MFSPTHVLISRTKKTPVQLVAAPGRYQLYTEADWQQGRSPAFELKPKQGLFCGGVQVVGFQLQPLQRTVDASTAAGAEASQVG